MPMPEHFFAGVFEGVRKLTGSLRPPRETLENHLRRVAAVEARMTAALKKMREGDLPTKEAIEELSEAMGAHIKVLSGGRE